MAVDPIARRFEKALFPISDTALDLRFGLWRRDARAQKRRQRTREPRRASKIARQLDQSSSRHVVVYYPRADRVKRIGTLTRTPRWTMRQRRRAPARKLTGKDPK